MDCLRKNVVFVKICRKFMYFSDEDVWFVIMMIWCGVFLRFRGVCSVGIW